MNRLIIIRHLVLALHHPNLKDPVLAEPVYRLIDEAQGWDAEQDALALLASHVDDSGCDDRFAAACGGLNYGTLVPGAQRLSQLGYCPVLVVP